MPAEQGDEGRHEAAQFLPQKREPVAGREGHEDVLDALAVDVGPNVLVALLPALDPGKAGGKNTSSAGGHHQDIHRIA